ncbi:MAG: hypothetical protein ACLGQH_02460, partial [Acidobacteriota bacterium]
FGGRRKAACRLGFGTRPKIVHSCESFFHNTICSYLYFPQSQLKYFVYQHASFGLTTPQTRLALAFAPPSPLGQSCTRHEQSVHFIRKKDFPAYSDTLATHIKKPATERGG